MSEFKTAAEYHVWFDSIAEMVKEMPALQKRANTGRWSNYLSGHRMSAIHWFGAKSPEDAIEKVTTGWPELLAKLSPTIELLKAAVPLDETVALQVEVRRRKRHRGDYGDTLDMHRVWGGQLDTAWERPVREARLTMSERHATVFLDITVNAMTNASETLWRAAAGLCMIEVLTRMGVSTEIWVGTSSYSSFHNGPRQAWTGVRVKEFTQPINEERLATAAYTTLFRTYGFGMIAAAPYQVTDGWGSSADKGLVKPLRDRQEAGERVFRVGECLSMRGAVHEIRKVIAALAPKDKEAV